MERIAYVSQKWHYIGSKPLFMNDELFAILISNSDTISIVFAPLK